MKEKSGLKECILMVGILLIGVVMSFFLPGCGKAEEAAQEEVAADADQFEQPELSARAEDDGADFVAEMEASAWVGEDEMNFAAGAETVGPTPNAISEPADGWEPDDEPAESELGVDVPEDARLDYSDDPYGMYLVSEEYASEVGGLYVGVDGKTYSLTNIVPSVVISNYGVGYTVGPEGANIENSYAMLYLRDKLNGLRGEIPSTVRNAIVSSGDFPAIKVYRDNQLMFFGRPTGEKMHFEKVDFVGYTIPACDMSGTTLAYYPVVNNYYANDIDKNNIGVFNLDDSPVEDVRNLEQGKEYLYECYLGTEYREIRLKADARCYSLDAEENIELPMQLTKLGYFAIDISGLEPGYYTSSEYSTVFEVVD